MIVDIVDKYCTNDNNPIKNLRLKMYPTELISIADPIPYFLGLPDPDPLVPVRGTDPAPDPASDTATDPVPDPSYQATIERQTLIPTVF
jgi:hypothetical protein